MAKNLNEEHKKRKGIQDRVADAITNFSGSLPFVYIHLSWFVVWVLINLGIIGIFGQFDPFPFGLLTPIVSLEAIFLSTFVMISQNRQATREELRAELDYETDVKAEKEIAYLKSLLEAIAGDLGYKVDDGKVIKKNKNAGHQ